MSGLVISPPYVPLTILTATSNTKTAGASDNFHQLTNNSVTLTVGTWELIASATFARTASVNPLYTAHGVGVFGANGGDSSSAPTALASTSNLTVNSVSPLFSDIHAWRSTESSVFSGTGALAANTIIVTVTASVTVYVVTYSLQTTSSDTLITAYLTARKIY